MAEVSTLVTSWLLEWLEGHSVSGADWATDICEPEDLIEPGGVLDWEQLAALCDRLAEYADDPPDSIPMLPSPAEIGREIAEELFLSSSTLALSGDVPPEILLVDKSPGVARDLFPELKVRADMASDGEVILFDIALPKEASDSPAFFELIKGALEAAPLLVDQDIADVALEIQPNHGRYAMRIPTRLGNVIPLGGRVDAGELGETFEDLSDDLLSDDLVLVAPIENPSSNARTATTSAPTTVNPSDAAGLDGAFAQTLAACASELEIGGHLFGLLRREFRSSAGQLWIGIDSKNEAKGSTSPSPAELRLKFGESDKPPSHSLQLAAGGDAIGRIDVWDNESLSELELEQLDAYVPWYAMALSGVQKVREPEIDASPPIVDKASVDVQTAREFEEGSLGHSLEALSDALTLNPSDLVGTLVRHLARHIDAHHTVLSLRHPNRATKMRTLVAWREDALVDNYDYDAKDSPCERVLAGEVGCYPEDVQHDFESDASLVRDEIQSYVGVPLRDTDGTVIGTLSAWSRSRLRDPQQTTALLRVLGNQAESQLQNRRDREARTSSDRRIDALRETTSELVFEISPNFGLTDVSSNVSEILGYKPSDMSHLSPTDMIHPEDMSSVKASYRALRQEQETITGRLRLQHRDSTWRWFEVRARSYWSNEDDPRIVISARDITEASQLEQEHSQMASVVQNSSDMIGLVSLGGEVLFLNASGQRLLGIVSDEDARSRSIYDFVSGDDERAMKFDIMPAVHRKKHWSGEVQLQNVKTDARFSTSSSLSLIEDRRTHRPVAIAVIARDVSERHEHALALKESEERYRMLAENPYGLIAEMDERARFIYASSNFETILGHAPQTLLGSEGISLIHADDKEAVAENFINTVAELGSTQISFRVCHVDGSYRWFETTLKAYRTARKKLVVILISRDSTDRIESDEALIQSEQKLLQSQKMEAIGRMAGGIAHDFNNLLTAITGYCDLLLEELSPQHPSRPDAEEILKASERAAGLTHQLLAFSRRQVLQPRVLDLNNLVADMDRMLRRLIGKGIELVTLLGGAAWPVKADPSQLQQVMLNLVVNARDAMPEGGRITIETANTPVQEPVPTKMGDIPVGDYLTLSVTDTGGGIAADLLEVIFEPFFTTKESDKGTGLGLSTVIGIVQQSGGYIEVESVAGRGSTFIVYLPKADQVAMLPESDPLPEQFRGTETVLLLEDSESVRRLIVRCLKSNGYTVLEAGSGVEALRLCNRHAEQIDLLLTDVILPKMDGFEAARRIQAARPEIKVVYMSGFVDDAMAKHGLGPQDVPLLEKPFTPSTLMRTVREYLDAGTMPLPPMRIDPSDDSHS